MVLTKKMIQGMLFIFTFCIKNRLFLAGGRSTPPPLLADMSSKKSIFFDALSNFLH